MLKEENIDHLFEQKLPHVRYDVLVTINQKINNYSTQKIIVITQNKKLK